MQEDVRSCGCDGNNGCGNSGCCNNNCCGGGFLSNLFGGNRNGCGCGDNSILFFILIFLLLFCNNGCGNNGCCN